MLQHTRPRVPRSLLALVLGVVATVAVVASVAGQAGAAGARPAATWGGAWVGDSALGSVRLVLSASGGKVVGTLSSTGSRAVEQIRVEGTEAIVDGKQGATGQWRGSPGGHWPGDSGMVTMVLEPDGKHLLLVTDTLTYSLTRAGAAPAPAATSTAPDTKAPTVVAHAPGGVHDPATRVKLRVTLTDDSGKASLFGRLLDGGTVVKTVEGRAVAAKGGDQVWDVLLAADLKGPLYACFWAQDAGGNRSRKAPSTSCVYISLLVDIDRVSNTCGGDGWEAVVWAENTFGNTTTVKDPATGKAYTVNFGDACNLHDAGYGGHTVKDRLNDGVVDYHLWSRARVDAKFRRDLVAVCRREIPESAAAALSACIRNDWRYAFVRKFGGSFFDADLMRPGTQAEGQR